MYISLRKWNETDAETLALLFNNLHIWNNLRDAVPFPYTLENAKQFIAQQQDTVPVQNFAILNHDEIVGGIGINLMEDIYRMNVEMGYWIAERFWGMGIATIATGLMSDYVFQTFAINRIVAEVFEPNKASMRVLEKNGFTLECVRRKGVLKNDVLLDDYVWVKHRVY